VEDEMVGLLVELAEKQTHPLHHHRDPRRHIVAQLLPLALALQSL
jgi:hypothetical protein